MTIKWNLFQESEVKYVKINVTHHINMVEDQIKNKNKKNMATQQTKKNDLVKSKSEETEKVIQAEKII